MTGATPAADGTRLARRRLATVLLRPRATRGQAVTALLCAAVGFAAVVQIRTNDDADLATLRQSDLVRILEDASQRSDRLRAEALDLERTRDRLLGSSGTAEALSEARRRERTLGILAGTLPATGPGIELVITDPQGAVGSEVLLDALQELRDAGAEAVEMGGAEGKVRVIASTALTDPDDGRPGVVVDGTRLAPPYRVRAIGDAKTLAAALDIPGGVLDTLRQRNADGTVTELPVVSIGSLRRLSTPQYARAVPEPSATSTR